MMRPVTILSFGLLGLTVGCSDQAAAPAPADIQAPSRDGADLQQDPPAMPAPAPSEVTSEPPADPDAPVTSDDLDPGDPSFVLDHTMTLNDGTRQDLTEYAGQVLLVVNTASRCGLTPQYEGLESLQSQYGDRGFSVLGFPANNFGGQEPGTDQEIREFCDARYGVSFPLFSKISVTGEDVDGLYEDLTGQPDPIGGNIPWNFTKFLVDRSGHVVARFEPRTAPTDPALTDRIEALVAAPR